MPIEVKKTWGGYSISYACQCGTKLKSKGEDAGKRDICPECGRQFIVPGERAMAQILAKESSAKEASRLANELTRQTKASKPHQSLEFLALLEDVVEDGELTNSEIRDIARWINEHADGRQHWPANMFLPLLKDVFADGQIDKSESRLVAGLIQSVRRDWARHYGSILKVEGDKIPAKAGEMAVEFAPDCAKFPVIPISFTVPSESDESVEYELDFQAPSCTCPDFNSKRKHLPNGHISRCCKHLMRGYAKLRPDSGWPGWLEPFLEAGFKPMPDHEWDTVRIDDNWFLVSSPGYNGWANAYASLEGESVKYGYSTVEDRWSYGTEPPSPEILERAILKLSR